MSEKASLEERVVEKLKEKGWQIVCAESCTGGMLASTLVNVAGVSQVLGESYVTYANSAKESFLEFRAIPLRGWEQ